MGSLSDYGENAFMGHICGSAYTPVATVYLGLCTADPTDAATGASCNEVANANNYARTAITFGAAASRKVTQSADVTFPQASGAWGTVTHYVIVTSNTYGSGNVLAHGAFSSSFAPVNGNTPKVASGQCYVQVNASSGGKGFATSLVHSMLNLMFRNTAYSQPATYVALSNSVLDDADATNSDFTEVSGTGYGRVLVNKAGGSSPAWAAVSGGATSNANAVTLGPPGGDWTQMVAGVLIDSASGSGNIIGYDNNLTDQIAVSGDTVQYAIGALTSSMT